MFGIIGIILIIVGIVMMGKSPGIAFLLILVGLVLDVIGIVKALKKSPKKNSQKKKAQTKAPTKKVKTTEHEEKPEEQSHYQSVTIPDKVGTAALQYQYKNIPLVMTNEPAIHDAAFSNRWELTAQQGDGKVTLFSDGVEVGYITERERMLNDWIKRDDPYRIFIQNYNSDTGTVICLFFYRDKRKGNAWREQATIGLRGYTSDKVQDTLTFIPEDAEVDFEENESGSTVYVMWADERIGKLPPKAAKKYIEEGFHAAYFVRTVLDDEGNDKPVINIYWNTRAPKGDKE